MCFSCESLVLSWKHTGTRDHHISIWNMDGSRSVPLWRSAIRQARGPDILKGHTGKVVGLCALPELVCDAHPFIYLR